MNFQEHYKTYQASVESEIKKLLPPINTEPTSIHQAMHYALEAGGKRLRPILLIACSNLKDTSINPVPAAVATEFLHTYTLVHDDLPCMDNSDLRRGRPATHIQFGETIGVLAGDALLTEAFRLIATAYERHPEVANQLTRVLADAASSQKLIGGQVVDTLSEGTQISVETLNFIHLNKTAALISASMKMGLILAKGTQAEIAQIEKAGTDLGLAFQIVDDILDLTSDAQTMGKTVGADAENQKNTYPKFFGIDQSRAKVHELTHSAKTTLESFPESEARSFLTSLFTEMENRIS